VRGVAKEIEVEVEHGNGLVPEADIAAGISAVEAVPLLEHRTRTFAVVSWVAAVDGVEDDGGPEYPSHSALRSWYQERCCVAASEHLPQAAPYCSSFGNVGERGIRLLQFQDRRRSWCRLDCCSAKGVEGSGREKLKVQVGPCQASEGRREG
jgi:hypothetical protein